MPKKKEIVEIICHTLNGGDSVDDTQSRFHPAMVEENIGDIYKNLISSLVTSSMLGKNDNFQLDFYTKTFTDVPVAYDEERCEYYSELPCQIIDLPFQKGVRFISPVQDQSSQFVPRSNNSSVVFDALEVGMVEQLPKYYYENGKVYYKFSGTTYPEVLMKLCPTFFDLDDDDEVAMPAILTKNGVVTLHDLVVNRMRGMAPEDLVNDSNPVQV